MIYNFILAIISISGLISSRDSLILRLPTENKIIYGICFAINNLYIADGNNVIVFDIRDTTKTGELKSGHHRQILTIDVTDDNSVLVSGGKDSTIVIWDLSEKTYLKKLCYHKAIITSLQITPDKKFIISGGSDGIVNIYDIEKDIIKYTLPGGKYGITAIDLEKNGELVAVASGKSPVLIFDISTGRIIQKITGHKNRIYAISFTKDGSEVIYGGGDPFIYFCNVYGEPYVKKNIIPDRTGNWILGIETYKDNSSYSYCGLNGRVNMVTNYLHSYNKFKVPVNKVVFLPDNEDNTINIAVATRGKGVFITNIKSMKLY